MQQDDCSDEDSSREAKIERFVQKQSCVQYDMHMGMPIISPWGANINPLIPT